ncbi:iron-sulfur cluster assembly accessory protein [Candidatus Woesearchaeota archaeon]|nr:iron-sulfur cluster assembly accessory protein [Candidatus Woesearchaeota archaeon]
MKINKGMVIAEVVENYPHTAEIFEQHGLHCIGCSANPFETLESGIYEHGLGEQELNNLIKDLNNAVESMKPLTKTQSAQKLINVTPSAAEQIKLVLEQQKKTDHVLKLKVVKGGCAGYSYELTFVKEAAPTDVKYEEHGLQVFVDKESLPLVQGAEIDYVAGLMNPGFKIRNPNQHHSCGCGNSFR